MHDDEIAYLVEMLTNILANVYYKPGTGDLVPVVAYQAAFSESEEKFPDPADRVPEPVVWLGGSMSNQCAALHTCTPSDFVIVVNVARWPECD